MSAWLGALSAVRLEIDVALADNLFDVGLVCTNAPTHHAANRRPQVRDEHELDRLALPERPAIKDSQPRVL